MKAVLLTMRVVNMHKTHPRADYSHTCARCSAPVGIFPSGQQCIRDHPDIEILCEVCGVSKILEDEDDFVLAQRPPGGEQEEREAIDFTKRKQ